MLIDDDNSFARAIMLMLDEHGAKVDWFATAKEGIGAYAKSPEQYSLVILDYDLPDLKGSEVRHHLRRLNPDQIALMTSGHERPDYLVDMLQTGVDGFLPKGNESIRHTIVKFLRQYEARTRVIGKDQYSPSEAEASLLKKGFVGRSKALFEVARKIEKYVDQPYPVLIIGETGVGKELVAEALVPRGKRLITVNCASFRDKENLLESELFGHVKGAFTGADKETTGLAMLANNNVFFLDELHQLSISGQAKLLRFLQDQKFRKVGDGSGREISVNFRLVSTVQPDIMARISDGRFLEDLLHRVNQLVIHVPSLSERPEDIEPLVRKFQDEFNEGKPVHDKKQFRISTVSEMMKVPWPGELPPVCRTQG